MANKGKGKIELLLEMKNRLKEGISQAKKQLGKGVAAAKEKVAEMKAAHTQAFSAMKDEIPGLSRAVGLLRNPYALLASGIAAVGAAAVAMGAHLFSASSEAEANKRLVAGYFNQTGKALKQTTATATATAKVFDKDIKDIAQAANAMQKEYASAGLSADESFKLIQKGLLATNGQLDLQEIKEYSTQMRTAGLSAEQSIALMSKGVKEGIFSDKAPDSIKEASLRLREMPKATKDALKGIGLDAAAMQGQLNNGSLSVLGAVRQVSKAMKGANAQARQTAMADVFGGAGEDAGQRFILSLADASLSMKGLVDAQDPYIKRQMQRLDLEGKIASKLQEFSPAFSGLKADFDILVLKARLLFYNVVGGAVDFFKRNILSIRRFLRGLKIGLLAVSVAFGVLKAGMVATFVWNNLLIGGFKGLAMAIMSVPLVGWVLAAIAAFAALYSQSETFRAVIDGIVRVVVDFVKILKPIPDLMAALYEWDGAKIKKAWGELKKNFGEFSVTASFKAGRDESLKRSREEDAKKKAQTNLGPAEMEAEGITAGAGAVAQGVSTEENKASVVGDAQRVRNISLNMEAFHKGDKNFYGATSNEDGSQMTFEEWMGYLETIALRSIRNLETSL